MQFRLLLFLLLLAFNVNAQRGMLFVKRNGIKKVATFNEGMPIHFISEGRHVQGVIGMVRKDSILIYDTWFGVENISRIVLRDKTGWQKTFILTTAGVALATAGMRLAKWDSFERSLAFSSVIGYGNFAIHFLPKFMKRRSYPIGKKYRLQAIDLHF